MSHVLLSALTMSRVFVISNRMSHVFVINTNDESCLSYRQEG